nr:hypothetical protein Iba_chr04cCG12880 [Ipomoea batatas]
MPVPEANCSIENNALFLSLDKTSERDLFLDGTFGKHFWNTDEDSKEKTKRKRHSGNYLALLQLSRRPNFSRLTSSGEEEDNALPFEDTDGESSRGTPRARLDPRWADPYNGLSGLLEVRSYLLDADIASVPECFPCYTPISIVLHGNAVQQLCMNTKHIPVDGGRCGGRPPVEDC